MSLEQIFERSQTLKKLERMPLGRLLDEFCTRLQKDGFRRNTIRHHLSNLSHFNEYLRRRKKRACEKLSLRDANGFFRSYRFWCRNQGPLDTHLLQVRYSLNRFIGFLRIKGHFDISGKPAIYQPVLDEYLQWMCEHQNAATRTIDLRRHSLGQFLQRLGPEATAEKLSRLTADRVEVFFLEYAKKTSLSTRRMMQSALRTFFRFCLHRGYIYRLLDHAVPTLRTYKLATVPRGLTEEQARKVLMRINRNSDAGRRDYAICQLLYTYGVRGGQVRTLRLEDIDWEHDLILFRASKQGKDSLLPLTRHVGDSLLDYFRNARPRCAYREVFLTALAPYRPLPHSCNISTMVKNHIRAADIEIFGKGGHAFRHGFAARMLAQDHSLKEIADVLGHRHLSTTFIYAKVDFKALKPVCLKWPLEVQS